MRLSGLVGTTGVALLLLGCNSKPKEFSGPTVDAFNGKVVADGKPVEFPPGEQIVLRVYHQGSAKMFGIPLQPDGTFKIGWMPIGTYTAILARGSKAARGSRDNLYSVPGTFTIADGQTEYVIELGKSYKP